MYFRTMNEFYIHTLLLLTLPKLIGSLENLKQFSRWITYYFISKFTWRLFFFNILNIRRVSGTCLYLILTHYLHIIYNK